MPAPVRVLVGSQFGIFFAGNALSLIGTWMQRIACSWLVWEWTHSAFWLGVLAAGDLLPVVLIGPFAGVVADRFDRLKQNRAAQFISALLAILMAGLLVIGKLELFSLVALVTAQGALVAAVQPARLAMVQQMVRREDMATAVALNSVCVNLARLLGPAAAGVMILHLNVVWIFIINALVTFCFVIVLGRLKLDPHERPHHGPFFRQMAEGFTYVLDTQALRLILLVLLLGGVTVRAMLELVPAIAAQSFSSAATGLAVLTGAAAVGAVTSGLTVGRVSDARLLSQAIWWWAIGAVATIVLTRTGQPAIAVLSAVLMGAAITRALIGTQTFVQLTTVDKLRGRTLSVHGLIARASPALGALAIGFFADRFGLGATVSVSSGLLLIVLVVLGLMLRGRSDQVAELD